MINYNDKIRIGKGILNYIKENGYTKKSFSKLVDISRPTLNTIIDGNIKSETTFKTHINKILKALDIDINRLLECDQQIETKSERLLVAYSNNSPKDYKLNDNEKTMFELVENLIDLFEIYL